MIRTNQKQEVCTIPNAISLAGAAMTWHGAERIDTPSGTAEVIVGRSLDTIDGPIARATGQASDVGAFIDATSDKIVTAKLLHEMWRKDVVPKPIIASIIGINAVNAAATIDSVGANGDTSIRPVKSGKFALALETGALFAHAIGKNLEESGKDRGTATARSIGNFAFIAALPLAAHASYSYIKQARDARRQSDK